MTHSGGKPHAIGDRGQRFEVTFFDPEQRARRVYGWFDDQDAAIRVAEGIKVHPLWRDPKLTDRWAKDRLCDDCAHCAFDPDGLYCAHTSSFKAARPFGLGLLAARSLGASCGPTGKHFEIASDDVLRDRGRTRECCGEVKP